MFIAKVLLHIGIYAVAFGIFYFGMSFTPLIRGNREDRLWARKVGAIIAIGGFTILGVLALVFWVW